MPAFDRISSGLPGLDHILDCIRLGDNLVWQVDSVDEYRAVATPFARQALADGRTTIYIRFAPHAAVLDPLPGLTIHRLDPSRGFESFTGNLHRIIAAAGRDAFYIFDSLSELQTAWAADLMMGNFFVVTCPYLFELDTVAWFCLLRQRHSYDTIARIRETTQILIDLFADNGCLYIHPLKVWKRYSPTMFFPHRYQLEAPDAIRPLTDGVSVSRFYQLASGSPGAGRGEPARSLDSWERFFLDAAARAREQEPDQEEPRRELARELAGRLIGQDARFLELVARNCSPWNLLEVRERMIGSGMIGGKAAGMLLARWILGGRLPETAPLIEPHDSWYIGSHVFYTYLVHNRLWKQRVIQRTEQGYFSQAPELARGILAGGFPAGIREEFVRMLEYYGQSPIIVRSSSLLEDSFGHAFAGKYESVFCVNTGSPEDRLEALEEAVKRVYASMMDESALAYRRLRGLQNQDEQMAILVQRVSGSLFCGLFMPAMGGVGYSFSSWRWQSDLDPSAGMLRVVAGLGTRAVDRTGDDYPRLVSLDKPDLDPSTRGRTRYSQRFLDCLDLDTRQLVTRPLANVISLVPDWLAQRLAERDTSAEARLRDQGRLVPVYRGTCPGLVRERRLLDTLRRILATLQCEYQNPVDIEFTVNWTEAGDFMINLLQCRPLQTPGHSLPSPDAEPKPATGNQCCFPPPGAVMLRLKGNTMGPALHCRVDALILVDPAGYHALPYRDKPSVARAIGLLNSRYREQGATVMLLVPGRIGTTSPELGVPVSFAEISNMRMIFEIACSEAGYQPELSWGSHFFQDLVEAEIFYGAIPEEALAAGAAAPENTGPLFRRDFFEGEEDLFPRLAADGSLPTGVVSVYEPGELLFWSDVVTNGCLCGRIDQSRHSRRTNGSPSSRTTMNREETPA